MSGVLPIASRTVVIGVGIVNLGRCRWRAPRNLEIAETSNSAEEFDLVAEGRAADPRLLRRAVRRRRRQGNSPELVVHLRVIGLRITEMVTRALIIWR